MLALKIKVEASVFNDSIKNRFCIRDEHILIHMNGIMGYVLDDDNKIQVIALSSITVKSLEPVKDVITLSDYMKKNPKIVESIKSDSNTKNKKAKSDEAENVE